MINTIIKYVNENAPSFNVLLTFVLVAVTLYYAVVTRRIMKINKEEIQLSYHPIIAVKIRSINIGKVYGNNRRSMSVDLELCNIGNSPAIDIKVDSDIKYSYSSKTRIPSRFEPGYISYLKVGEKFNDKSIHYGNKAIFSFFDDVRESIRLNMKRIDLNPSKAPYGCSILNIYIYYKNSFNKYFKTQLSVEIDLYPLDTQDPFPKENETKEVSISSLINPNFNVQLIIKNVIESDIKQRNEMRELSGW